MVSNHEVLYKNLMAITNQRSINTYIHTHKRKKSKLNIKDTHQITKKDSKRRMEENCSNKQQMIKKMTKHGYLPIFILNVKETILYSKDMEWLKG